MKRVFGLLAAMVVMALLGAAVAQGAAAPASATVGPLTAKTNYMLGDPKAPVVVTLYASVTCAACAEAVKTDYPMLKSRYVDTGQVRFEFREAISAPIAQSTEGAILARCTGARSYWAVIQDLMENQSLLQSNRPSDERDEAWFGHAGRAVRWELREINDCLKNADNQAAFEARRIANTRTPVIPLPYYLVNGALVAKDASLTEAIDKAIAAAKP